MGTHGETMARLALAKLSKTDPAPYDRRTGIEYDLIRVEIVSTTHNQVIPNGQLVALGTDAYEIYANQLEEVEALVETATDAELAQVTRDYERHLRECAGEDGDEPRNTRPYFPSFQASFRQVLGRDQKPFTSLEVLTAPKAKKTATG